MNFKSIKIQLGIFLLLFSAYTAFLEKDVRFLLAIGISVISAAIIDCIASYLKKKEFVLTESSIITGLIIGCVLSSREKWWLIALTALLAIASKHIIRFRNKHFFNPAAFGIIVSVFFLGASTEWKGAYLWYVIAPFGAYVLFKIKKLELVIGYFIASFILFGGQAIMDKVNIFNILGYLNYFFIFIMLIEPMTTPATKSGKIIFGLLSGVLIFIFYMFGVKEAELVALLCANLLLRIRLNLRRQA